MAKRNRYSTFLYVIIALLILFSPSCEPTPTPLDPGYTGLKGIINDIEGNSYKTIGIGTQIWMAENLRSTRFNDSTLISNISDSLLWGNLTSSAYCWYNNDTSMRIPYGALYNWYSINTDKLCPTGWRIPTEEDWTILINRLGGDLVASGKLKVIGTDYWNKPNAGASNSSMFNAVPSGSSWSGSFSGFGRYCNFATVFEDETSNSNIFNISLWYNRAYMVYDSPITKTTGVSVRCIKN